MKMIDFTKSEVQVSFEGDKQTYNVAKVLGNAMMFNGSILLDIGFEDLAKKIYYSTGEVEVPTEYERPIIAVVKEVQFSASVKRELIRLLNG